MWAAPEGAARRFQGRIPMSVDLLLYLVSAACLYLAAFGVTLAGKASLALIGAGTFVLAFGVTSGQIG